MGTAVALVAIGAGVWWFTSGSSGVADDGPHKLTTPATVLGGEYKRQGADQGAKDASSSDAQDLAKSGITNAKQVGALYATADLSGSMNPSDIATSKAITFTGIYGRVKDPGGAIDEAFSNVKNDPDDKDVKWVGDPRTVSPDGLDGAVMKCQEAQAKSAVDSSKTDTEYICMWADFSTLGMGVPVEGGMGVPLDESAQRTADLRKDVRVTA